MRKFIFNSRSINATVAGGGLLVDASFFDDEEDMDTSEDKTPLSLRRSSFAVFSTIA